MIENFNKPPVKTPEVSPVQEHIGALQKMFDNAEQVLESKGREEAKPLLGRVYEELQQLNKWDKGGEYKPWAWNKDGDLTEDQFNELDLRRKKLSNAIGILTADGTIRHDVNKI